MVAPLVFRLLTAAGKLILTYSKKRAGEVLKKGGKKITKGESDKITGTAARKIGDPKKEITALPKARQRAGAWRRKLGESGTDEFKKGGAVKRYKGGLMVKPKAAKRGY
jgi:hypothetical protein